MKNTERAQRTFEDIVFRCQTVMDSCLSVHDSQSNSLVRKAIWIHACASKIQGEILEAKNLHTDALDVY